MADNTTINAGSGGDVIATDDLTTLNGGAVSGFKAQRTKAGWGPDGTFTDVNTGASALPVQGAAAAAAAIAGNPVLMGGSDGTNARALSTNTAGVLNVDVAEFPAAAALADATANPTTTLIGAANFLFNGTTWDRQRSAFSTTTGDTGTKTASFTGATQTNTFGLRGALIVVQFGTVSGTSPTCSVTPQVSPDGGTTWLNVTAASGNATATNNTITINWYPGAAALTGGTQNVLASTGIPRTWRLNFTIGGTTPSFALTNVWVNYLA